MQNKKQKKIYQLESARERVQLDVNFAREKTAFPQENEDDSRQHFS